MKIHSFYYKILTTGFSNHYICILIEKAYVRERIAYFAKWKVGTQTYTMKEMLINSLHSGGTNCIFEYQELWIATKKAVDLSHVVEFKITDHS